MTSHCFLDTGIPRRSAKTLPADYLEFLLLYSVVEQPQRCRTRLSKWKNPNWDVKVSPGCRSIPCELR